MVVTTQAHFVLADAAGIVLPKLIEALRALRAS
jgi:hypothetical protein